MANVKLHHLEKSRSHRILWLFHELGLEYDIVEYKRDPKTMRADPALRNLHPLGKAPLVELDGTILAESGAIIEALLDRFDDGTLRPVPGSEGLLQFRYWLHYAEGSMMAPLLIALILGQMAGPKVPFIIRPVAKGLVSAVNKAYTNPELERHYGFVERHLSTNTWFAGDSFTAADSQMSYPVNEGRGRAGITAESHPNIHDWLGRIKSRHAYTKAIEVGGDPSFSK